jgi:hypothetical protein
VYRAISRSGDEDTVSIEYASHCRLPISEAQKRFDDMRKMHPEWYGGMVKLTDASDLGLFGHEIAMELGMDAKCNFWLLLVNTDRLEQSREAVELAYRVFGTDDLVITYGMDSVRKPMKARPPMKIDQS